MDGHANVVQQVEKKCPAHMSAKKRNAFRRATNAIKFANRLRQEVVKIRHSEEIQVDVKINEDGKVDNAQLCLRHCGKRRESLPCSFGRPVPKTGFKKSEVDLPNITLERDEASGPELRTIVGTKLVTKEQTSFQQAKAFPQNNSLQIVRVLNNSRWKRLTTVESLFASKLRKRGHFVENCYVVYE